MKEMHEKDLWNISSPHVNSRSLGAGLEGDIDRSR